MKVTVGHAATASLRVPYRIIYKCYYCGAENIDTSQNLFISKSSNGGLWADQERLKEDADNQLQQAFTNKLQEISAHKFQSLELKCRCVQCGQLQPWSSYVPITGLIGPFLRFIVTNTASVWLGFLLIIGWLWLLKFSLVLGWMVAAVFVAPSIIAIIKNINTQRIVDKLPDENLPDIAIQLQNKL